MAATLALILALAGGASVSAALGALTIPQLIAVAQFGATAGVTGIKVGAAVHQQLAPLRQAILAKLQADIAKLKADAALRQHSGVGAYHGDVVAHPVGGPIGWGRAPVVFVYQRAP
jgi:hypothetical protein